jgi:hypothetical protein
MFPVVFLLVRTSDRVAVFPNLKFAVDEGVNIAARVRRRNGCHTGIAEGNSEVGGVCFGPLRVAVGDAFSSPTTRPTN